MLREAYSDPDYHRSTPSCVQLSITLKIKRFFRRIKRKMSSPAVRKAKKEEDDIIDMDKVAEDTKSFIDKVLGDVSKSSASRQLVMGTASGWVTGFITMKVGKMAAVAVGGGIILLQVANHKGYININWDKVYKQVDKVADKAEERISGQSPNWMEKVLFLVERYVDRKVDKAEDVLKKKQRKARRWYHSFVGDGENFEVQEIHIFLTSFMVGLAVGIVTG
ncbi:Uncharacterized protein GBIM_18804 [Gryllus bimaculatus]|nr:Uncharacterized protein GBIM_18804 [Gryllus bimaculatus]